jgi:predicted dehydrogenase
MKSMSNNGSTPGKLRVAIIGVGGIAQGHVQRTLETGRAEIVAICDPSPASIEKTRKNYGAGLERTKDYSDYRKLLEESKPDAVIICSRHCDHYQQIIDSLDSGAHVLTEKPLVNTVAEGHSVVRKAQQTGKVVGIAYQRHMAPHFRYIHQSIKSGEFGAVQAISALQQQRWKTATAGSWRQDPAQSGGGQLHDSGSHLVDILLWTTGLSADTVSAQVDRRGAPVDINDVIAIRFREGALGTITIVGDAIGWYEDITIWCEKGAFYVREKGGFTVQSPDGTFSQPSTDHLAGASNVDANFIAAIHGEEEIAAPPICGMRAMELTEAAWKSGELGGNAVTVQRTEV